MKRYKLLLVTFLMGCSERMLDPLDPNSFPHFSGTALIEVGHQRNLFTYYRDGRKLRIVPKALDGTHSEPAMALIIDEEEKTTTAISMATKQYAIRSITDKMTTKGSLWPMGQNGAQQKIVSRETVGQEIFGGHNCTVQKVIMESTDGKKHTVKLWSAHDLHGFAVKVDASSGKIPFVITFSDVTLEPINDHSLFSIPGGFKNSNG